MIHIRRGPVTIPAHNATLWGRKPRELPRGHALINMTYRTRSPTVDRSAADAIIDYRESRHGATRTVRLTTGQKRKGKKKKKSLRDSRKMRSSARNLLPAGASGKGTRGTICPWQISRRRNIDRNRNASTLLHLEGSKKPPLPRQGVGFNVAPTHSRGILNAD